MVGVCLSHVSKVNNLLLPISRVRGSPIPVKESDILSVALYSGYKTQIGNPEPKYAVCFSTYLKLHFVSSIFKVSL